MKHEPMRAEKQLQIPRLVHPQRRANSLGMTDQLSNDFQIKGAEFQFEGSRSC